MNPTTANLATIEGWLDQLAQETDQARHSTAFTGYLQAMAKFWRYSTHNTLLIMQQRPDATHINSRKRWAQLGYTLGEGQWKNSIQILCPHFKTITEEETGQEEKILHYFTTGYIYDVAQMEAGPNAQPLSAPWVALAGEYDGLYALLHAVCTNLAIAVTMDDLAGGIKGYSTGKGQIVLARSAEQGNIVQALVHELAHEICHPVALRPQFSRQEVETQAEAIAYCVGHALGMETPNSPTYMALYEVTPEVLKANAQAIHHGVQRILREVERVSSGVDADAESVA